MKDTIQQLKKTYTWIDIILLTISIVLLASAFIVPNFIAVWIAYAWLAIVVLYASYSIYTYRNRRKNNG